MTSHLQDGDRRSYRFGRFELRPAQRLLLADGVAVALGSRAFDVLVVLVERRASVVGKDELLERVWPGLVVEEANVQVQVSALRKVIGAGAVATVARRGYRFVAPVEGDFAPPRALPLQPAAFALAAAAGRWPRDFLNSFEFLRTPRARPATLLPRQTFGEQEA